MSRPQTVKRIWAYVKERDLQDPADRRQIRCDEGLKRVFGCERVHMFTMVSFSSFLGVLSFCVLLGEREREREREEERRRKKPEKLTHDFFCGQNKLLSKCLRPLDEES